MKRISALGGLLLTLMLSNCKEEDKYVWKPLDVKVSAFNSVPSQTDRQPNIAAWGDTLKPGMKCIAISRDLINLGIGHNTKVMIEGMPGTYLVKDKMNAKYRKRIDIYMGEKVEKAKKWGVKDLGIVYAVEKESTDTK